jgi:TonB-linked SusC/RagA family outer membrane protein
MSVLRTVLSSALMVLCATATAAAQQYGTITGRVTDGATGGPLSAVQIQVAGTNIGGLTSQDGRFLLTRVPLGQQTIRAVRIGYAQQNQTVAVTAGAAASVDFTLDGSAVAVEGLVVTATGEVQRTREVGLSVGKVEMDNVALAANSNVSAVLAARVPGVSVTQAGGTTGTGSRIRIRGSTSVSLNNDPLIVIDGVRASNSTDMSIGVGGQNVSRIDDIASENIEKIEVLKGPSASALYGTAAANGVIVITTKRGTAGGTRWRAYVEGGSLVEPNEYPTNYLGWCSWDDGAGGRDATSFCDSPFFLSLQADGLNPQRDSVQAYNPLEAEGEGPYPFQDGVRQKYGLSAQGGGERTTYYLSADWQREKGVYADVSDLKDLNVRANLNAQLTDRLDGSVSAGYVTHTLRLPQNDNNSLGILPSALLGGATPETAYGFFTLPELKAIDTQQKVQRFIGSAQANLHPLPWLSFNGTLGMDLTQRHDNQTIPPERIFSGSLPEGNRTSNRLEVGTYTAQLNGSADFTLTSAIASNTNVGVQYVEETFLETDAFGRGLLAGCFTLNCVATGFAVDETTQEIKTLGGYLSQQFAFNDRLFVTGTLRADDNSAFGTNLDLTFYPSANLSWVIVEEPWFPQVPQLSLLRLRAGYGESGLQPGFRTARRFLNPSATVIQGAVVPGFTIGGVGNPDLRPEISREVEVGADLGLFNDRLGLEVTYYDKKSRDALVARDLAYSLGVTTTQTINIGKVHNSGVELLARGTVLSSENVHWDASVSYSTNDNELTELGIDPTTGEEIEPIIFGLGGDSQRFQEGFPLGAYFARTYTYADADNDGFISADEVTLSDEPEYLGTPFPTREASVHSSVSLFNVVRLSALVDHKGGYKMYNATAEFRCAQFFNCDATYAGYAGVDVSLADQAAFVASAYGPAGGTVAGYMEDGSFWKLREVTATISLPQSWANSVQAERLSLTLAGRNLATWTDYGGPDPELNGGGVGSNFSTFDFLSQPPVRVYTVRLDLTF